MRFCNERAADLFETTVDDMSPQLYEPLMERLFCSGALDVYLTPVLMKKSRPGIVLTALCAPEKVTDLSRVLFEESPTIALQRCRLALHEPIDLRVQAAKACGQLGREHVHRALPGFHAVAFVAERIEVDQMQPARALRRGNNLAVNDEVRMPLVENAHRFLDFVGVGMLRRSEVRERDHRDARNV